MQPLCQAVEAQRTTIQDTPCDAPPHLTQTHFTKGSLSRELGCVPSDINLIMTAITTPIYIASLRRFLKGIDCLEGKVVAVAKKLLH
jgi:hypothetical protein